MSNRMIEKNKREGSNTLKSLRRRGKKSRYADRFVAGYEARDPIMQAAQFLRKLRADAGLTQAELAERAGMSQPDISRMEGGLGKHGPSVETLGRLANACKRDIVMRARVPEESVGNYEEATLKFKFDAEM